MSISNSVGEKKQNYVSAHLSVSVNFLCILYFQIFQVAENLGL